MSNTFCINHDKFNLVLIGCGGTGGNLIPMLTRLMYSFINSKYYRKSIQLTLVDGDVVEEKNLFRQPFIKQDVGRNKAQIFAERYGGAFGLEVAYMPQYIHNRKEILNCMNKWDALDIIIGCVDNDETREIIYQAYKNLRTGIWIDSGNEKTSGQVIMGVKKDHTTVLPCVVDIFPEVLEKRTVLFNPDGCSRALPEDVRKQSQNLVTNATAAVTILNFLSNIFLGENIKTHMVNFNTQSVHVKPEYINVSSISLQSA